MSTRTRAEHEVLEAVDRFGAAFDAQDVDATLAAMTDDCVFESTAPPDGVRAKGREAVGAAFAAFFAASAGARFETEDRFSCGDRVVQCWRYTWPARGAEAEGHVRGIDVYLVRDGLVSEKRSYVKG